MTWRNTLLALATALAGCSPEEPRELEPIPGRPDLDAICRKDWDDCDAFSTCNLPERDVYTDAFLQYMAEEIGISVEALEIVATPGDRDDHWDYQSEQQIFFELGWFKFDWWAKLPTVADDTPTVERLLRRFRVSDIWVPKIMPGIDHLGWRKTYNVIRDCEEQLGVTFPMNRENLCSPSVRGKKNLDVQLDLQGEPALELDPQGRPEVVALLELSVAGEEPSFCDGVFVNYDR